MLDRCPCTVLLTAWRLCARLSLRVLSLTAERGAHMPDDHHLSLARATQPHHHAVYTAKKTKRFINQKEQGAQRGNIK